MSFTHVTPGMWLNPPPSLLARRHSLTSWLGHPMSPLKVSVTLKSVKSNFCSPLHLASLLHLQVQCACDQAVKTATEHNDTLRSEWQQTEIYFFQAIILDFKLEQGAQHGHFIDWIREKLSWLICMMTLLSCVCSYDRNKRGFIGLSGAQGEKGKEKLIERWAGIRLGAFVLSLSSKGSLLLCYPVYTAHCCVSTAAFPNTTNCVTKETGISCSSSLVDAHITLIHHPDENICDLKTPTKSIWRWISCLRDIFMQARCLKTVVLHDTYWQAGHITVHSMWATESLDLFLLVIYFYIC